MQQWNTTPVLNNDLGEILVIDDDTSSLFLIQDLLHSMGLGEKVTVATNVPDALTVMKERIGTKRFPEVVFLDIRMPEHDGFTFLEKMSVLPYAPHQDPKVVILSYYGNRKYQEQAEQYQVTAYLRKPLTREKVLDIINLG
jgi:CheY-like chemotaxis protein